tara:strand:- start:269 stop:946 length:678 start_codon:yes stop_codon:yes gene_type:complete
MYKFHNHPYLKLNLSQFNFNNHILNRFKNTFNYLPNDNYIKNNTRKRLYRNYIIEKEINNIFSIYPTSKNTFTQNVQDDRKNERTFELISEPMNPFIIDFLTMSSKLLNHNHPFQKISVDFHQVRQVCYPNLESHNSMEGIHKDGADYIISATVLNRFNITGGYSSIYDNNKNRLDTYLLNNNDFIFQNDKDLYHYVSPIYYQPLTDATVNEGYRDIVGIDIKFI